MDAPIGCDPDEKELFVSPIRFEAQMADLAGRGLRSVSLGEYTYAGNDTVLITFDDGYSHVTRTVTPVLQKYGFTAVMFVPAAYMSGHNEADAPEHPRIGTLDIVGPAEIAAMAQGPWEIASHGFRHVDLTRLDRDLRLKELTQSREILSSIRGKPVRELAYPYGYVDRSVEASARLAGYRIAFGATPGPSGNAYRIPRHPIRGSDDLRIFRLKSSGWFQRLHSLYAIAPAGARARIRAAINVAVR